MEGDSGGGGIGENDDDDDDEDSRNSDDDGGGRSVVENYTGGGRLSPFFGFISCVISASARALATTTSCTCLSESV